MQRWHEAARGVVLAAAAALATTAWADMHGEVTHDRIRDADKRPGDWLTYHGTYKGWHYAAIDQINTKNIDKLRVAWTHAMPRSVRGLQSMPLAANGVLYYSGAYNQVFALDGSSGEVIWYYRQKLNEDLVSKQTHSPYNRGIALGLGHVYMGTLDGKLVAIDMKTGKLMWETKLIDSVRRVASGRTAVRSSASTRAPARNCGSSTRWAATTAPSRTRATPGAMKRGSPAGAGVGWPGATTPRTTPYGGAPAIRPRCTIGPAPSG
jgi:glucose dehydrogenase